MYQGTVGCMKELGITESFRLGQSLDDHDQDHPFGYHDLFLSVKRQVLVQASEAAEMILR